jgi:hypothetical protein
MALLERRCLFFRAYRDNLTINDAVSCARRNERSRKFLFQHLAAFRMADEKFDKIKKPSDSYRLTIVI